MEQNLSLYHIFLAVAEAGNITNAARFLYISQPAVSKAVTNLEESLGTVLFIRSSRGVKLTEEGTILYEYVRKAFDSLSLGEERLKRIKELGIGHLKIGASTTLCKYLLLPHLDGFVKEYPHIKITIENQSTYYTLKQLSEGSLDIGLVAKSSSDKALYYLPYGEIEDIFVATSSYLDNLKLREDSLNIFTSANIMLLDEENISRKYIDDYFRENDIHPEQILEVSNMDLLIEFAKTGLGVACVIKNFVKNELNSGALVQIPLRTPINKREVGFAYAKDAFLSVSLTKFLDYISGASVFEAGDGVGLGVGDGGSM